MPLIHLSRVWRRSVGLAALALVLMAPGLPAQSSLQVLGERAKQSIEAEQHRVMAFYYPWYGMPEDALDATEGRHWPDINRQHLDVGMSKNYPLIGPYDSQDRAVIEQHMQWAKEHHIDTMIVSWWGHGDYSDKAMAPILASAKAHGVDVTVYYEGVPKPQTPATATQDITRLLEKYGDHPAFLTVDDQPVVFVYGRAVGELGTPGWTKVQQRLSKRDPAPVVIGDALTTLPPLLKLRDGSGQNLGSAIVYAELERSQPRGGRILYVWHRLLDGNRREALLYEVFNFLAGQTE
jgi:hypothetical protein